MLHINSYATVIFADIQGYVALMEKDESLGIAALDYFVKHMRRSVSDHDGRLMHFWGDGCLALFDCANDALSCCIQLQLSFRADPVLPVRIGINCGNIIETDCNAYGFVVNVAARLESISLPGSVLLTERVKSELTEDHLGRLTPLGKVEFQNIDRPIEVFAINYKNIVVPNQDKFSYDHTNEKTLRRMMRNALLLLKSIAASLALAIGLIHIIY